ncbi:MAG: hypothetical protein KGH79_02250 [Patescibacteria group bacterium]|nr:hypothetical protein [Patescibacteria group bacterium]
MDVFKRWDFKSFLIFAAIVAVVFIGANFFSKYLSQIAYVILAIELVFVVAVTWSLAVHAVLKSLFGVSAGLSLIIFLAQAYCAVPNYARTADDALKSLVAFGLVYVGIQFFWSLYKEAKERSKTLKEANDNKRPWIALIPFALFTGLFAWQVIQVLLPIVQTLCIYQK